MKKLLPLLLTLAVVPTAHAEFDDVPASSPFYDGIEWARTEGIVEGYSDGSFRPNAPVNRAEFVKILVKSWTERHPDAMKSDTYCTLKSEMDEDPFPDVDINAWYGNFVCLASGWDWVSGYPDGTFKPANQINYAEGAKIVVESNSAADIRAATGDEEWYAPYVQYLAERDAKPSTVKSMDQKLTRGEMVEMMYRLQLAQADKTNASYQLLPQGNGDTVVNYENNVLYRYSISAPEDAQTVIKTQTFAINGGRWSGPALHIYSDAEFTDETQVWTSASNWTLGNWVTFSGDLTIAPGEKRFLELTADLGIPADGGFTVTVNHQNLDEVVLDAAE